jgi:hypothetical protein
MYVEKRFGVSKVNSNDISVVEKPKTNNETIQDSNVGTSTSQVPSSNGAKSMQQVLMGKAQLLPTHANPKLKATMLSTLLPGSSGIYYKKKPELEQLIFEMQLEVFAKGLPSDTESRKKLRQSMINAVNKNFKNDKTLCDKFTTYINKKFGDKAEKKLGTAQLMHFRGDEKGAEFLPGGTTLDSPIIRSAKKSFFQVQFEKKLGHGGSGRVYRAILLTLDGEHPAAAKEFNDPKDYTATNELDIISKLTDNDYVSLIRDSAQLLNRALLFIDFAAHGDCVVVQNAVAKMPDGEEKTNAQRSLGRRYVEAMAALHAHQPPIRHLDFKPDNLLLTADGRVIVVDFGVATTENKFPTMKDGSTLFPPTKQYADPQAKSAAGTPGAADLFALGMSLYVLEKNYWPDEVYELKEDGSRNWENLNPEWKGFDTSSGDVTGKDLEEVAMMLMDADPARRPSLEQVRKLPCFKDKDIYTNEELVGLVKGLSTKEA